MAENIAETIAKLIRMRDSAKAIGSLEESAAFAAKISQLLLKHKLSMNDIDLSNQDRDEPVEKQYWYSSKKKTVAWEVNLAQIIAKFHFCEAFPFLGHKGTYKNTSVGFVWVGRKSDREVALFLFEVLLRELQKIQNKEYAKVYVNDPWSAQGFRESFRVGALNTIEKRFREMRQQEVCTENAIILVNSAEAAVAKFVDTMKFVSRRSLKYDEVLSHIGYEKGVEAGNKVNLSPNPVGANKTAAALK